MRIGIMLRALSEKGGVGVYTGYITEELLARDGDNEYFLYHQDASTAGRFSHFPHATERVIGGKNKALWDQVSVPMQCRRDRIDVLFHPKFTVPLVAGCKTVMVLHGAGWFIPEHARYWSKLDLRYLNTMMPLYCRKAAAILSVSQVTTDVFNRRFSLPEGKVRTVYLAPGRHFRRVKDETVLRSVREKYDLPNRFVFTLSKFPGGDRKNIHGILAAYESVHRKTEHTLVVGGKDCHRFRDQYAIPDDGYGGDILFPGYISQEDLPAVYTLADLFLYPSNMEAFPIPITEAMSCGTAIVTSDQNGLKEIAGDAAVRADAEDPDAIAEAVLRVLGDAEFRASLGRKGIERAARYTWDICAQKTLDALMSVA